jgi:CRAL/TRIO domain
MVSLISLETFNNLETDRITLCMSLLLLFVSASWATMDFDLEFDYNEALTRQKRSQSEVDALRELAMQHPLIPKSLTDKQVTKILIENSLWRWRISLQLLIFLDSCGSPKEAEKVLKIYYNLRNSAPQFFKNRDPESPEVQQCFQVQRNFPLPAMPNGDLVYYNSFAGGSAWDYHMEPAMKTFIMSFEGHLHKAGPRDGLIIIFDLGNIGLMHLTRLNLAGVAKFSTYLHEALPAKLRAIHVMNTVFWIEKALSLLKPFISAEIFDVVSLVVTLKKLFTNSLNSQASLPPKKLETRRVLWEARAEKLPSIWLWWGLGIDRGSAREATRRV